MSLFWDVMYLFKKTPWDTGITPAGDCECDRERQSADRTTRLIWAAAPAPTRSIWRSTASRSRHRRFAPRHRAGERKTRSAQADRSGAGWSAVM